VTCGECGAALPERAKFCLECGTPVAAGREHELRKTVTLLFTDVTGSTVLGELLDPEAYRAVMGRYFAVARDVVERHGGIVEKFVGDAVLAVFGIPDVREDDALRAVRAAADLQGGLQRLSEELQAELGVRLQVRTGVNTGPVVAGSARAGGAFATGDAVNTAARLEQAAPPGEVLLGATTYELVRDAVEVEPIEPVSAKGKSVPLVAFRLLGVGDSDRGRARRFDTVLVGRERESRALADTLDRAVELRRGHLVTILGPPGIGKTRLVADFVKDLGERAVVVTGRCVSYGQGITYFPVVQLLREALRLQGDESAEVTHHALDELFAGEADGQRVVDLLLALLGKHEGRTDRDDTFWAIRRAIEQLASRQPLVITVDDLHWAEPTLLALLEHLRDEVRDLPLLLVCQARPELLDNRPGWGGGTLNAVTFGLEPFSTEQTSATLQGLLDGPVSDEVATAVADWAGGNPLFVEEIVGHLVERGLLGRSDGVWRLSGDLSTAEVPPTVAALLSARLALLPAEQLSLAEQISVVGLELTEEDAVVLSNRDPGEVHAMLVALGRRDLLRRHRTDHGDVWSFKHILIRDAAYESLSKALRAELHERYAAHVAATGDEVARERAAFVAHHLEHALRYRRELGATADQVESLVSATEAALLAAEDAARAWFDLPAALTFAHRLTNLDGLPAAARRVHRLRRLGIMFVADQVSALPAAIDEYAQSVGQEGPEIDHALLRLLRLWHRLNAGESLDPAEVVESAAHVARLAREHGDDAALNLALTSRIDANATLGLWSDLAELAEEAASLASVFEARRVQLFRVTGVVHGKAPLSALVAEVERQAANPVRTPIEEMMLSATRILVQAAAEDPQARLGIVALLREHETGGHMMPLIFGTLAQKLIGDLTGVVASARALAEAMERSGDLSHASTVLAELACFELESGDSSGSGAEVVARAASFTSEFDAASVALVAAGQCLLAGRASDLAEVERLGTRAIEVIRRSDQLWQNADIHRWVGLSHRWCGDTDGERHHLEQALELYRHKEIAHWTRVTEERLRELR
jgi:class 3 adenylate cyclase